MSRVVPTKPGWWYCRYKDRKVPTCLEVVRPHPPYLMAHIGGNTYRVLEDPVIEWLAPVPSVEAVQALVAAAQRVVDADDHARDALKNLGVHDVGGESLTEDLRNAFAGLTGEGE